MDFIHGTYPFYLWMVFTQTLLMQIYLNLRIRTESDIFYAEAKITCC